MVGMGGLLGAVSARAARPRPSEYIVLHRITMSPPSGCDRPGGGPARVGPGRALPSSHPLSPRIISARDVSSTTAPVARSSRMLAPQARHRQVALSFQFSVLSFQQGRPIRRYGLKTEN